MFKSKSQIDTSSFKLDVSINSFHKCDCNEKIKIIVARDKMLDGFKCVIHGVNFDVGFDKEKKIVYYSTRDSNFLINNFQYLTKNRFIIDSITNASIIYDPSSGAYIKLPQDWNLGFAWSDIVYNKNAMGLKTDAVPIVLFKRSSDYKKSARWTHKDKGARTTTGSN